MYRGIKRTILVDVRTCIIYLDFSDFSLPRVVDLWSLGHLTVSPLKGPKRKTKYIKSEL